MSTPTTRTLGRMLAGSALVALLGCGQGLYTRGPVVEVDADGAPKDTSPIPGDSAGNTDEPRPSDDGAAACPSTSEKPDQSITKELTIDGGELPLCEAVLKVDRFIIPGDVVAVVTLRRSSSDGVLKGPNTKALGPLFQISSDKKLPQPVVLEMTFKPFIEVPTEDLRFAYYHWIAHQWIAFTNSRYDGANGRLVGKVDNMDWDNLPVAPFAACSNDSDCVPPLPASCRGQLCQ